MAPESLADLSAAQASERLERREISAAELIDAVLARIERDDPRIRAWRVVDAEGARLAADGADERARGSRRRSALDGIPVGIKDLIDTRGIPASYGSPIFDGHVPRRDAHCVGRLRQRGLVVIGKTVTTQFGAFDPAETRNPHDARHTPGGSSSGSAAAVAAAMVPLALGTQAGGSTIRPASYCGVVGFMPSPGWIGRTGIFPCSPTLDRVGLFARSVTDVTHLLDASLGRDVADPLSILHRRSAVRRRSPRRVGVFVPLVESADAAMRTAVLAAIRALEEAGTDVVEVELSDHVAAQEAHLTIMRAELARVHQERFAAHRELYAPHIAALIESGRRVRPAELAKELETLNRARQAMAVIFERVDLLVGPSAVGPAEGSLSTTGDPVMNLPATFRGLPAISLPMPVQPPVMPMGLQLIGKRDHDRALLGCARWIEEVLRA